MGVATFFRQAFALLYRSFANESSLLECLFICRWLRDKYLKAVVDCKGGKDEIFDNLYLDVNGIAHNCSHGDDLGDVKPQTEKAMFEIIFHYIDRMVTAIKLRKLLYIALDGVAPRAKLNQQRSRRFRSAQDAKDAVTLETQLRQDLLACENYRLI